jgi:cation:H+ antiporter
VDVILVVIGVVGLYFGGESLVRHASSLAGAIGVSPMAIGLTVVAFGTSAPELAATLVAAWRGAPELAVANVIGSNVANIGLILGLTALAYPLVSDVSFVRREVPWMLAASVLAVPAAGRRAHRSPRGVAAVGGPGALPGGRLPHAGGGGRRAAATRTRRRPPTSRHRAGGTIGRSVAWIAVGIAALALGAQALVDGATGLALAWGVRSA